MKRKTITAIIMLAVCLCVGCTSTKRSSARSSNTRANTSTVAVDNRRWDGDFSYVINTLNTGTRIETTVEITGYRGESKEVVIPETINELQVATIGERAFANKALTSVIIPEGVRGIRNYAFSGNNLTSINIPESIVTIGKSAFERNRLTSITIPRKTSGSSPSIFIEENAFYGNRLTSITILSYYATVRAGAFHGNNLTSITVQDRISNYASALGFMLFGSLDRSGGTFVLRNGQWFHNSDIGNSIERALPTSARLICGDGIHIVSIDDVPFRIERESCPIVYLEIGFHKIIVSYSKTEGNTTTYTGNVTFEHALILDGGTYDLSGTPQGNQILFQIKKR